MTIGANALADYTSIIGKQNFKIIFPKIPKHIDEFCRKAYKGGCCMVAEKYANKIVPTYSYDINSHYPTQLRYQPMPYGTPKYFKGKFAGNKDKLYIHTEEGWATPTEESWYLDYDNDVIDWHFQSQELSLGNINYKKRIVNITLQSLETDERKFSAILTCKNFRKTAFVSKEEVLEYKIDVVRTYVHRLNYLQSVQFQYLLSNDKQRAKKEQTPLSLSAAIVKYEIGEAVR